ncbi:MAG: type II toxin-antitoxin system RelE/ParE family toxin [Asticcacaulis sp.]|nr:type II toxin-antitoxin system RelE/ParE family toxin [Asticcacaulis sp.]
MATEAGYILSPLARRDLEDIWTYTRDKWSRRQADVYLKDMLLAITGLADGNRIGISADDIRSGYWKHWTGSHVIFYRRTQNGVDVVRILHQNMDVNAHLNP